MVKNRNLWRKIQKCCKHLIWECHVISHCSVKAAPTASELCCTRCCCSWVHTGYFGFHSENAELLTLSSKLENKWKRERIANLLLLHFLHLIKTKQCRSPFLHPHYMYTHPVALIWARVKSGLTLPGFLTLGVFEGRFNLIKSRLCSAKAMILNRLPFWRVIITVSVRTEGIKLVKSLKT